MSESTIRVARTLEEARRRVDYMEVGEPQKRLCASILSLPQLIAGWTMGCISRVAPQVADLTGQGNRLTNNNNSQFGESLSAPYADFDGVNQYLSRADGGANNWADVTGTEAYVPTAQRGLTFGGWFQLDRLTNAEILIGKGTGVAAASSYYLSFRGDLANDPFQFTISNGAALTAVNHTASVAPTTGQWYYVVGRFDPGAEIKLYLGNGSSLETSTNVAAIPAALNDSATAFAIGSFGGGATYLDGRASCCFLCCGMLSDAWVSCLYSQLRSIFRV